MKSETELKLDEVETDIQSAIRSLTRIVNGDVECYHDLSQEHLRALDEAVYLLLQAKRKLMYP